MKIRYTKGNLSTEFEGDQVEVFGAIAQFQEIFEETSCGKCGSEDLRYVVRTDKDENSYHELHCKNQDCRAKLAFGQHKKKTDKTLFPKRKDAEGNYLPDRGWLRWNAKTGQTE